MARAVAGEEDADVADPIGPVVDPQPALRDHLLHDSGWASR